MSCYTYYFYIYFTFANICDYLFLIRFASVGKDEPALVGICFYILCVPIADHLLFLKRTKVSGDAFYVCQRRAILFVDKKHRACAFHFYVSNVFNEDVEFSYVSKLKVPD